MKRRRSEVQTRVLKVPKKRYKNPIQSSLVIQSSCSITATATTTVEVKKYKKYNVCMYIFVPMLVSILIGNKVQYLLPVSEKSHHR